MNDQNLRPGVFRALVIIIIILVLIIINIFILAWPYFSGRVPDSGQVKYPLIDKARSFIDQEHFIVNVQPLREQLRELVVREGSRSITLYFEFLNTGANVSINPDLKIWPVSLAKLPLAMATMKKVENSFWNLDTGLVMQEKDKFDGGTSRLASLPVGTKITVEELVKEMLIYSDNTAYLMLFNNTTPLEKGAVIEETGLEELFNNEGKISGKEYSRLFRSLYTSSFLSRENSSRILSWLSQAEFNQYLTQGLSKNVVFANKYGQNALHYVYANSGIVYVPNRPYIITVIIQGDKNKNEADEEKHAQKIMKEISLMTYKYINSYKK